LLTDSTERPLLTVLSLQMAFIVDVPLHHTIAFGSINCEHSL
jgi:hypothetical protein